MIIYGRSYYIYSMKLVMLLQIIIGFYNKSNNNGTALLCDRFLRGVK